MPTFDADARQIYAMLDRLESEAEGNCVETSSVNSVSFVQTVQVEMSVTSPPPPGGQPMELLTI